MSLAAKLTWLRRSSTLRWALVLSGIFAVCMAAAVFVALSVGRDVFERRIDQTLFTLARASPLDQGRGDTFAVILRAPDDTADLPKPFERAIARGGGTVQLAKDFRQTETWRVLVTRDSQGAPGVAAVPLDDG